MNRVILKDGGVLQPDGQHWALLRNGAHIRYLNKFESEIIRAALAAEVEPSAAREALEQIALAGMSGTGQESPEGMQARHARRAWEFIRIAARALDAMNEDPAAQTVIRQVGGQDMRADPESLRARLQTWPHADRVRIFGDMFAAPTAPAEPVYQIARASGPAPPPRQQSLRTRRR